MDKQQTVMNRREVTQVCRNDDGDITALCHPGEPWSPRFSDDAISDIEAGRYQYYVRMPVITEVDVNVVHRTKVPKEKGFYLRTDPDGLAFDDLGHLPLCESVCKP